MRKSRVTMLAAVLTLGLGACDEAATGPGGGATMQVAARGDDAPASRSVSGGAPAFSRALSGAAEGTVDFRARVYVRTDAGSWVEVTRRAAEQVSVDASGRGDARVFATAGVEAGGYDRVRVVFEEVRADVTGGVQVGLGVLTGQVRVDLQGDDQVVVERSVDVEVRGGGSARLEINLNSDAWLGTASGQTRTASEAAFQSAVTVTAQAR